MTKKKPKVYIAIRTGKLDKEDAMIELDNVIKEHGYCWFGKYGQPLNRNVLQTISAAEGEVIIVLIEKDVRQQSGYKVQYYMAIEATRALPKESIYPAYYKRVLGRMGTWLKLVPYPAGKKIMLGDLMVKSSMMPLIRSLQTSMRGHFICISRG